MTYMMSPGQDVRLPWTGFEDRSSYVDFRGHRYAAPWRCLCCGVSVDLKQFLFDGICSYCDLGHCNLGVDNNLSLIYQAGHGLSDVILAAPVIDINQWCGLRSCTAHVPNMPKWLQGPCPEFQIHPSHSEIIRRCHLRSHHGGLCEYREWV